ncbi:hypothetical protein Zmor_003567 [Zophobas morio]|uniref:Uncharacterized protein n=1 Tax=Zophobas morio TaxID=2755281 RepID=A0AA38HMX5_9CUCU|nr:hypothetical protein Zmor_003567 [Zophobas morio]
MPYMPYIRTPDNSVKFYSAAAEIGGMEEEQKKLWEQIENKDRQLKEQGEKKDQLYEELLKQKDEMTKLQIKNNNLQQELKKRNTEYLRVTGSLHIRSVCEEFEISIAILASKNYPREQKWKMKS